MCYICKPGGSRISKMTFCVKSYSTSCLSGQFSRRNNSQNLLGHAGYKWTSQHIFWSSRWTYPQAFFWVSDLDFQLYVKMGQAPHDMGVSTMRYCVLWKQCVVIPARSTISTHKKGYPKICFWIREQSSKIPNITPVETAWFGASFFGCYKPFFESVI